MARKNPSTDKEQELNELIASYETAKAENRQLYLDGDQLADIADKYATDRRFDEAQEVISYGLELHPGHTDLLVEQAYLYLDTMQLQKAIAVVDSIAEDYDPEVKLLKAEILLNEGKLDEAETLLNSIEEEKSLETIIDVAYLYMDMGYPEKALPWLTLGLEEYKENEEFLAAIADCYRSGEHNTKAISFYNKLIDKNPYNPSYWTGLAKCHFSQQEFDKAVEACDFALAADDNFGEAHIIRAHSLFHLENETEAIQEYQLALQNKSLPPDFAHMFIGLAYANQEKWELAYRSYEQAMEIIGDDNSPILSDIYSNEIFCLSKLGRYEEAHQLCEKAKKQLPESVEIYLQEGRLYLEEDKFEEAKQCWAVALQYAPEAETLVQIGN
ncbi:MAG: tetratricopeptide repeat protein, partial [Bacteroides nordii]